MLAEFRRDVVTSSVQRTIRKYLTFGSCAILSNDQHYDLKELVSDKFRIHPNEVFVVGSAKLGFSIVPSKRYRAFGDQSDIDLALITETLFDKVWQEVYAYEKTQTAWASRNQFSGYFLRGWIRPDKLPKGESFTFSDEWFEFFRELTRTRQFGDIKISAALYRNWNFFEGYQEVCVSRCKEQEQLAP